VGGGGGGGGAPDGKKKRKINSTGGGSDSAGGGGPDGATTLVSISIRDKRGCCLLHVAYYYSSALRFPLSIITNTFVFTVTDIFIGTYNYYQYRRRRM